MNDEACKVLFEALAQILSNQQDILRYLGVARHDLNGVGATVVLLI